MLPERFTPIPEVYQDTLEHIDASIAGIHPLGIETHDELIQKAYHQAETCGCRQCKAGFWYAMRDAVQSDQRHDSVAETQEVIDRYFPLADDIFDIDEDGNVDPF